MERDHQLRIADCGLRIGNLFPEFLSSISRLRIADCGLRIGGLGTRGSGLVQLRIADCGLRIGILFPEFMSSIFRLRITDCGLRIGQGALVLVMAGFLALGGAAGTARGAVLRVCATTPDLGSLARAVGGDRVAVTVFAKGTEDPHFIEARPTFLKELSQARLYLQTGLGLETGWASALLQNCRNAAVMPGGSGFLDASSVITPLGGPGGRRGPLHGGRACLRQPALPAGPPERAPGGGRHPRPAVRTGSGRQGAVCRTVPGVPRAAAGGAGGPGAGAKVRRGEAGGCCRSGAACSEFLKSRGQADLLGGWLGRMAPFAGVRAVADHDMWPYFGRRFGLRVDLFLEPKPGVSPTTRHLGDLIGRMKTEGIRIILSATYFDPRHAQFVAEKTGAVVVPVAHQVGARPGTDDYLAMVDYNVRQIAGALGGERPAAGKGE